VTLAARNKPCPHFHRDVVVRPGAGIPLVLIGVLSRQALNQFRGRLMAFGQAVKRYWVPCWLGLACW